VAADLSRFFGNPEIGVFFRHTDNGLQAGLRFAVPLTLDKELPPWRVRPRLPDLFSYEQSTTVLTDVNLIRGDIGRTLRVRGMKSSAYIGIVIGCIQCLFGNMSIR
jgi:hypothetical protein